MILGRIKRSKMAFISPSDDTAITHEAHSKLWSTINKPCYSWDEYCFEMAVDEHTRKYIINGDSEESVQGVMIMNIGKTQSDRDSGLGGPVCQRG